MLCGSEISSVTTILPTNDRTLVTRYSGNRICDRNNTVKVLLVVIAVFSSVVNPLDLVSFSNKHSFVLYGVS